MTYYSIIILLTVTLMSIMTVQLKNSNIIRGRAKKGFMLSFYIIMLMPILEWLSFYINGSPVVPPIIHAFIVSIEYTIAPSVILAWIYGLGDHQRLKTVIPLLIVNAIINISSIFFNFIFIIDANNCYSRGEFYWIFTVVYVFAIFMIFYEVILFSHKYQNRNMMTLMMVFIFLFIGISASLAFDDTPTIWIAVAISTVMYYIYYIELIIQSDELTKLLNRRSYEQHLSTIDYPTAILIFDVDNFKSINDNYGHAYGDIILKSIAKCIVKCYGKRGLCYRTGGDEFCVILRPGYKIDESTIYQLNRRFEFILYETRKNEPLLPNVSVGYEFFDGTTSISNTINNADAMMYETKRIRKYD